MDPKWSEARRTLEADLSRAALALLAHTGSAATQVELEAPEGKRPIVVFVGPKEHFAALNLPADAWHVVEEGERLPPEVLAAVAKAEHQQGEGPDDGSG